MKFPNAVSPVRAVSLLLMGVSVVGCAPDALSPEPNLSAAFAKPVAPASQPADFSFPSTGYVVTNDGASLYTNGDCNVTGKTFIDTDGTEDANLQMGGPGNKVKCSRRVEVKYSDAVGVVDHVTGMNVNDVGTVSTNGERSMNFTITSPTRCNRIGFGNEVNPGGPKVTVTRGADVNGKRTWNVSFSGLAKCVTPQGPKIDVPITLNFDVKDQ